MALNTDKLSYSIGQVAEIAGVAQSTLRYWETVIDVLNPQKTQGGSRRYNKDTVELVMRVKDLLHDQGLTIKGANLYLEKNKDNLDGSGHSERQNHIAEAAGHPLADKSVLKDFQYIYDELKKIDKLLE